MHLDAWIENALHTSFGNAEIMENPEPKGFGDTFLTSLVFLRPWRMTNNITRGHLKDCESWTLEGMLYGPMLSGMSDLSNPWGLWFYGHFIVSIFMDMLLQVQPGHSACNWKWIKRFRYEIEFGIEREKCYKSQLLVGPCPRYCAVLHRRVDAPVASHTDSVVFFDIFRYKIGRYHLEGSLKSVRIYVAVSRIDMINGTETPLRFSHIRKTTKTHHTARDPNAMGIRTIAYHFEWCQTTKMKRSSTPWLESMYIYKHDGRFRKKYWLLINGFLSRYSLRNGWWNVHSCHEFVDFVVRALTVHLLKCHLVTVSSRALLLLRAKSWWNICIF